MEPGVINPSFWTSPWWTLWGLNRRQFFLTIVILSKAEAVDVERLISFLYFRAPGDFCLFISVVSYTVNCLCISCSDAQRALELLQQYRTKLDQRQQNQGRAKQGLVEEDDQLQQSLDRVINVFQSQLFSALLGEDICCVSIHLVRHCSYLHIWRNSMLE